VNKNPTDATVCRKLPTANPLYMFRASQHPSSGVLKTVPAASGKVLILLMMGAVTPETCRVDLQ